MTDTLIQMKDLTNIQGKEQAITKIIEENPSIGGSNTPTEKKQMSVKRVKTIRISKDKAFKDVDHQVGKANLNTKEMNDLEYHIESISQGLSFLIKMNNSSLFILLS
jgi:hypothetical protein